jgi:hypothetical protein
MVSHTCTYCALLRLSPNTYTLSSCSLIIQQSSAFFMPPHFLPQDELEKRTEMGVGLLCSLPGPSPQACLLSHSIGKSSVDPFSSHLSMLEVVLLIPFLSCLFSPSSSSVLA